MFHPGRPKEISVTAAGPNIVDYSTRYGMNPAHSEVVAAGRIIAPGKALDMGCGSGRNALYLAQLGFDVTAVDANPNAIGTLQNIIEQEQLGHIEARLYDINQADLGASYDFIACTVTLMFLDPGRVDAVLADMQQCTAPGGHHLIVAAMSTDEHPCPMNFPFTLDTGELRGAYAGWELLKYNEDLGTMHNGAQLQFATMLARKPA